MLLKSSQTGQQRPFRLELRWTRVLMLPPTTTTTTTTLDPASLCFTDNSFLQLPWAEEVGEGCQPRTGEEARIFTLPCPIGEIWSSGLYFVISLSPNQTLGPWKAQAQQQDLEP